METAEMLMEGYFLFSHEIIGGGLESCNLWTYQQTFFQGKQLGSFNSFLTWYLKKNYYQS